MSSKIKILDKQMVDQKLIRLSWEIYENNSHEKEIVIVGISERGLKIAHQLVNNLKKISKIKIVTGCLDLDKEVPYNKEVTFDLESDIYRNKVTILCDDVLSSGKTLMYAAKHFLHVPLKKLSIVVLVDRNHNSYPIKADYIGLSLATTLQEYINVRLGGSDEGVYLS